MLRRFPFQSTSWSSRASASDEVLATRSWVINVSEGRDDFIAYSGAGMDGLQKSPGDCVEGSLMERIINILVSCLMYWASPQQCKSAPCSPLTAFCTHSLLDGAICSLPFPPGWGYMLILQTEMGLYVHSLSLTLSWMGLDALSLYRLRWARCSLSLPPGWGLILSHSTDWDGARCSLSPSWMGLYAPPHSPDRDGLPG